MEPASDGDYHTKCSKAFFGSPQAPMLDYSLNDLHELAKLIVQKSIAVTGVQPKLSLAFEKDVQQGVHRLTLVGLWGNYLLKPPTTQHPELVENEHASMRLAQIFGIKTVPFSLIRLKTGELAYLTRRIDREKNKKLALEDMCQLTERLTEYKYRGSVEQIAKVIRDYSSNPGLDLAYFTELVVFSWLIGNADMHLKNYSLLTNHEGIVGLAPAYDLVATKLIIPQDTEETALNINGKKSRIKMKDFETFAETIQLSKKSFENIIGRFQQKLQLALLELNNSFLSETSKLAYRDLLLQQMDRLNIKQ
ncbi:MAG: HipA domain-containing protein [Haliscomenobacter sp.]|uniref:HipA domain-containing protein n=1 Tax=Haliscomenobacter sp. TaxID=2717303 RepID=UPI0029AA788A|nr:HipA domain-containing protein [Haliscomenobacter sp.]MDX2069293.1 HipA domain-containing protein [Haliscomenobacter sp.]